jgi:hypothetical protein
VVAAGAVDWAAGGSSVGIYNGPVCPHPARLATMNAKNRKTLA